MTAGQHAGRQGRGRGIRIGAQQHGSRPPRSRQRDRARRARLPGAVRVADCQATRRPTRTGHAQRKRHRERENSTPAGPRPARAIVCSRCRRARNQIPAIRRKKARSPRTTPTRPYMLTRKVGEQEARRSQPVTLTPSFRITLRPRIRQSIPSEAVFSQPLAVMSRVVNRAPNHGIFVSYAFQVRLHGTHGDTKLSRYSFVRHAVGQRQPEPAVLVATDADGEVDYHG